jgi:hypothetical protein
MKVLRTLTCLAVLLAAAPLTAQDAVQIGACALTPNVASWPVTTTIDRADFLPSGLHLEFSKKDGPSRWPDVIPPGWTGPIQYTVWFGALVNGQCHMAASINWWFGESDQNSGPVLTASHYPANLWYLDRDLAQHTPQPGELIYVMVTAGAERGLVAASVLERSNVISVNFGSSYVPQPAPIPTAPPTPVPAPTAPTQPPLLDLSGVSAQIAAMAAELHGHVVASANEHREILAETRGISEWLQGHWKSITMIAGPFVTYATCRVTGKC